MRQRRPSLEKRELRDLITQDFHTRTSAAQREGRVVLRGNQRTLSALFDR